MQSMMTVLIVSISLSIDMLYKQLLALRSFRSCSPLLLTRSVNILPDTETEESAGDISTVCVMAYIVSFYTYVRFR